MNNEPEGQDDKELDDLLDQLSQGYTTNTESKEPKPKVQLSEDELSNYIINKSAELIESSLASVNDVKDFITQGQNPDELAALASLINATSSAIESLNKLHLLKKKHEMTKEIKALDWENKKDIVKKLPGNVINNNTQVLVASREEIIKQIMMGAAEEPQPKELESTEVESEVVDEDSTNKSA